MRSGGLQADRAGSGRIGSARVASPMGTLTLSQLGSDLDCRLFAGPRRLTLDGDRRLRPLQRGLLRESAPLHAILSATASPWRSEPPWLRAIGALRGPRARQWPTTRTAGTAASATPTPRASCGTKRRLPAPHSAASRALTAGSARPARRTSDGCGPSPLPTSSLRSLLSETFELTCFRARGAGRACQISD